MAIRIATNAPLDHRRYNAPVVSEVAALIVDDGEVPAASRDIILRKVGGGGLKRIYPTNQAYIISYIHYCSRGVKQGSRLDQDWIELCCWWFGHPVDPSKCELSKKQ